MIVVAGLLISTTAKSQNFLQYETNQGGTKFSFMTLNYGTSEAPQDRLWVRIASAEEVYHVGVRRVGPIDMDVIHIGSLMEIPNPDQSDDKFNLMVISVKRLQGSIEYRFEMDTDINDLVFHSRGINSE